MSKIIKACFVINDKKKHINSMLQQNASAPINSAKDDCKAEYIQAVEESDGSFTQEAADSLYQETKLILEELIDQAQKKAEQIILEAKEEAQIIKEEAIRESNVIKDNAYQEAYQQGYEKGKEQIENELRPLYQDIISLSEQIKKERDSYFVQREKELIEIVFDLTEKILGTVVDIKPEIICQIVKNILEQVKEAEKITIRVNPLHLPYLSSFKELYNDNGSDKLQFVEDTTIKTGDCQVVTENGFLDSRIDEQLMLLKNALLEVVDHA